MTSGAGGQHEGHGLEWRELHRGARPGDQFVRIARHKAFKKLGAGRYEIRAAATETATVRVYEMSSEPAAVSPGNVPRLSLATM